MNNTDSGFYIWERRKTIFSKITLIAQQPRHFTISIVLIAIFITGLFGCAPATPIVITIPTTPTINPTATSTIQPTVTPTPFPTQTPFVPKAIVKIAVHVPLSGGGSNGGNEILHAAELATWQLASPLTDLGYKVELVSYDDQSTIQIAEVNAREIVADREILCGIGHPNANVMVQASEIYHNAGLAFISPASTSTTVTDRVYPEVNRIIGRDDGQGVAGAQFAKDQGSSRVYIIRNNTSSSKKMADYFAQEAYRLGITVVGTSASDEKEYFETIIQRIHATSPDLVYFAGKVEQGGPFFKAARDAGYTGVFLGTDGINRSALADLAGPSLVDGGGLYYTEVVAPAIHYPDAAKFINDYKSNYDASPRAFAAHAYDATGICMKAIEEASKAKGGELPTRKDVVNAIRGLVDYKGITGTYNLNNRGDPAPAKYFVFKVVSPDPTTWDQNTIVATYELEPPR